MSGWRVAGVGAFPTWDEAVEAAKQTSTRRRPVLLFCVTTVERYQVTHEGIVWLKRGTQAADVVPSLIRDAAGSCPTYGGITVEEANAIVLRAGNAICETLVHRYGLRCE